MDYQWANSMLLTVRKTDLAEPLGPSIRAAAFYVESLATNAATVYIDRREGHTYDLANPADEPVISDGPDSSDKRGITLARTGESVTLQGPRLDQWAISGTAGDKVFILPLLGPVVFTVLT